MLSSQMSNDKEIRIQLEGPDQTASDHIKEKVERNDGEENEILAKEEWQEETGTKEEEDEEKPKKCRRCQPHKKRKLLTAREPETISVVEESEQTEDDEENEEEDEESLENEEEESDSVSEYSTIYSAVSFEWEEKSYEFLDLCDPGTMDDPHLRQPGTVEHDAHGKSQYLRSCEHFRIPPVTRFYNALATNKVDLTFHGISPKQMQAMCSAMEVNQSVEKLIFKGNPLKGRSCLFLSKLLQRNHFIVLLDLCGCRIGFEGAALLALGLRGCESLKELNLERCYIEDEGMKRLSVPLRTNYGIEKLILSWNNLGSESAEALGTMFYSNNCISYVNLDNNNLFDPASMKKFCRGLSVNTAVTHLSLRWNAMSASELGDAFFQFLKRNRTITSLNLSDNRLDGSSMRELRRGVGASQSLEIFRLARNPISAQDAEYLLAGVKACPTLKLLDLQEIWVRKEFIKTLKKIQLLNELEVVFGGVYSDYVVSGPDYPALILKRARFEAMKPKKRALQRDFGHFLFILGDEPLTPDQFMMQVKKFKVKVNKELFPELVKQFTVPKANAVDVVALRKKYLSLFPDTKPPEEKKTKKGQERGEANEVAETEDKSKLDIIEMKIVPPMTESVPEGDKEEEESK